jgi:hypothetical protein
LRAAEIFVFSEGAHVSIFGGHLRRFGSKALSEDAHASIFDEDRRNPGFFGFRASKVLNFSLLSIFGDSELLR